MPLQSGEKLGPYEIHSPLGAGGMGEVYKARDTRLDRSVAIKVLPDHIAQRDDARARFEREARAVASLNHPHICVLYDIGPNYMVMELIEGETLAARIAKGAIPLEQALTYATQIADALDRAHRAGVTHRDIKPQNIMLTRDGVKVLDFGLAKSAAKASAPTEATLTAALTTEGAVMGTPQYMAPEQFEGKEADARSDIWAFGAVLYEMVTGRKAFVGKTYASLVGAILAADPPPMAVTPFTPTWLDRLVRRCLAKDAEDRFQAIRDVVLDLKAPPVENGSAPAKASRWPWAVAGCLAVALGFAVSTRPAPVSDAEPVEFVLEDSAGATELAISPDGKMLAWKGSDSKLRVRPFGKAQARVVDDIDVAALSWSPDSRHLAYRHGAALKALDIRTFASRVVDRQIPINVFGSSWTLDGHIVMGFPWSTLVRVPASGGDRKPLFRLEEGAIQHYFPQVLSDGEHVLYHVQRGGEAKNAIYLARLDGKGEAKRIYADVPARYLPPSTLLVYETGGLALVDFDPQTGNTREPVLLAGDYSGLGSFAISASGNMLAFVKGGAGAEQITLYDRSGKRLETIAEAQPALTAHLELSPDGRRLLFERVTGKDDLWTLELGRNTGSRLTFDAGNESPGIWSHDGRNVYFFSDRDEAPGIYEISSTGAGTSKLVYKGQVHHMHASPDGKHVVFDRGETSTLGILDPATGRVSEYLPAGNHPQFSPDSRFVAYDSEETGRTEIYVQTFPPGNGKWQISVNGGRQSRWRGDGKEIYYINEGRVMAASIDIGEASLRVTSTKQLFAFRHTGFPGKAMAASADGNLFAIREGSGGAGSPITVRLNVRLPGRY